MTAKVTMHGVREDLRGTAHPTSQTSKHSFQASHSHLEFVRNSFTAETNTMDETAVIGYVSQTNGPFDLRRYVKTVRDTR